MFRFGLISRLAAAALALTAFAGVTFVSPALAQTLRADARAEVAAALYAASATQAASERACGCAAGPSPRQCRAAANTRAVAAIALDDRGKGEAATQEVIALYEEVTRLDPGVHWDWVELGRLYVDAGDLPAARRSAVRVGCLRGYILNFG